MASSETILSSKDIEDLLNNSNLSFENLKYLAKEVANNSWSPYSHFPVGAVVVGIDQNKKLIKLYIAKHRNGPTGEIDLMFRGDRVKFYGVEK